jgi:type II secretory pathway pseudopilin PulG
LVELLVVIAIIGVLVALLLPAVQAARESARRMQCVNNIKQSALAIHNYHDARGAFPVGCVLDAPCCSVNKTYTGWTIEILPYMENVALRNLYDPTISVGADTPVAKQFRESALPLYNCPSDSELELFQPDSGPEAGWGSNPDRVWMMSSYRGNAGRSNGRATWYLAEDVDDVPFEWRGPLHYGALKGREAWFRNASSPLLQPESMKNITDGTTHTLLIGEQTNLVQGRRTFWAHTFGNYVLSQTTDQKRTLLNDYNQCRNQSGSGGARACMAGWHSNHPGGMNIGRVDGSCDFLNLDLDMEIFAAMGSIAGAELVQ